MLRDRERRKSKWATMSQATGKVNKMNPEVHLSGSMRGIQPSTPLLLFKTVLQAFVTLTHFTSTVHQIFKTVGNNNTFGIFNHIKLGPQHNLHNTFCNKGTAGPHRFASKLPRSDHPYLIQTNPENRNQKCRDLFF